MAEYQVHDNFEFCRGKKAECENKKAEANVKETIYDIMQQCAAKTVFDSAKSAMGVADRRKALCTDDCREALVTYMRTHLCTRMHAHTPHAWCTHDACLAHLHMHTGTRTSRGARCG